MKKLRPGEDDLIGFPTPRHTLYLQVQMVGWGRLRPDSLSPPDSRIGGIANLAKHLIRRTDLLSFTYMVEV